MPGPEIPSVICAWCGRTVREAGQSVSHGICAGCTRRMELRPGQTNPLAHSRETSPRP